MVAASNLVVQLEVAGAEELLLFLERINQTLDNMNQIVTELEWRVNDLKDSM